MMIRISNDLYDLLKRRSAREHRSAANMLNCILADALVAEMAEENKKVRENKNAS